MPSYPEWRMKYSNEDFDRAQSLASELTEADRKAGKPAPAYGYSGERFAEAKAAVNAAKR